MTRTLTAYPSFTRSSVVCTVLGVNSASVAMTLTSPRYVFLGKVSVVMVAAWPTRTAPIRVSDT